MKTLYLFILLSSFAFANFCVAEQEEATVLPVTPIQTLKVEGLDFDNLPKESTIGNLSEVVRDDENSLLDNLMERRGKKKKKHKDLMLYPYAETVAYVNGQLCHVGNYTQSVIYTVLEGPYYGTQTTMTYGGIVMYVNYDYEMEYTPAGVILHHYYDDSKVITGATQVIIFR
jgi:hypothetical protein